jgi:hypothetical protein
VSQDLVLVPEVQARLALRERRIRLQVLVPYGSWTGCGRLRVLRLKMNDDQSAVLRQDQDDKTRGNGEVELVVGYESYQP